MDWTILLRLIDATILAGAAFGLFWAVFALRGR